MAKKGARKPAPRSSRRSGPARSQSKGRVKAKSTRRKGKRQQPQLSWQLFKAALGLLLLIMLVISAGVMAHHLLLRAPYGQLAQPTASGPPPVPSPKASETPQNKAGKKSPPLRHPIPTYEVFDKNTPADPAPKPKLKSPGAGQSQPRVAIIIDDLGYDLKLAERCLVLEGAFTFSMLPKGPFTRKISEKAHAMGHEIMLHLPMEPMEYPDISPGPGALLAEMTPDELLAQLETNLAAIPHVSGVNNHMGSRLSTLAPQMRQIFSRLKTRGLYYVDSRTTKETVGRQSAERLHLDFAERDIFIDHFQDADFIRRQLRQLVKRAYDQGYAIGIAHPHPLTLDLIQAELPTLKDKVNLVPVSKVVKRVG
jgi:polysaccharide deacetylase 2 family uncharacterized protein YibQ